MNYNCLCFNCFNEKGSAEESCPKCGYFNNTPSKSVNCLKPGTLLNHRYIAGVALGIGGFGITYRSLDLKSGGICAIKEYLPASLCRRSGTMVLVTANENKFNHLRKKFVEEARLLSTLEHRNIIKIYNTFFENNTAYYVMEYCSGIDLRKYTENFKKRLDYTEGMNMLFQAMNGLEYVHKRGILHRDIAPDNIFITKNNTIKLLDFGAARREMEQSSRALSIIVKEGYAPFEQYGGKERQGAYTDIYALGATFYHLFTGVMPVKSTERIFEDRLTPFSQLRPDLPNELKYCIEKCMRPKIYDRVKDIGEMKRILGLEDVKQSKAVSVSAVKGEQKALTERRMQYKAAALDKRIGAYLLDLVFFGLSYGFIFWMAALACRMDKGIIMSLQLLGMLIFLLVCSVCEAKWGKTPGKYITGTEVLSQKGGKAKPRQIFVRNALKLLGVFNLLTLSGGSCLHDKAAETMVCVKKGAD